MSRSKDPAGFTGGMDRAEMNHIEEKIRAYLDGELPPAEADGIREHCRSCPRCGRALEESKALHRVLEADAALDPPQSLWPLVRARLERQDGSGLRLWFALSASGAALAGLLLGVILGSLEESRDSWQQETWTEVGSLLAGGAETTLDEAYLAQETEEGGDKP